MTYTIINVYVVYVNKSYSNLVGASGSYFLFLKYIISHTLYNVNII
nr:MAG TPA: hypothetical protein [Caudoviricetes sp.]